MGKPKKSDWYADMRINNQEVQLKLDTGAQCNVLPYTLFKAVGGKQIVNSNVKKLVTFTGEKIKTVGRALLECEFKDKFYVLEFQIVDHNVIPVLGLQTCQELNVIRKVESVKGVSSEGPEPSVSQMSNILDEFSDIFHGLGKLKKL